MCQIDDEALECAGRGRKTDKAFQVTELSDSPKREPRTQPEETSPSSEESFRLIVETLPGLIAVMTADGGVEHVNRQVLDTSVGRLRS
jgi:PAS domain-containing protein